MNPSRLISEEGALVKLPIAFGVEYVGQTSVDQDSILPERK